MPIVRLDSSNIDDYIQTIETALKKAGILDGQGVSQVALLNPFEITSKQIAAIEMLLSYDFDFKSIIDHNEEAIREIDHYAALDALTKYYDPARHIEFYRKNYPVGTADEVILADLAIKAATLTTADLIRLAYTLGAQGGGGQIGIQRQQAEHDAARKFSEKVEASKSTEKPSWFKTVNGFFKSAPVVDPVEQWLDAILTYRSKLSMAASTSQQIQSEFKDLNPVGNNPTLAIRAITYLSSFYEMLKELKTSLKNESACKQHYLATQKPSEKLPSIAASPQFSLIALFEVKLVEREQHMLQLCFKTLEGNNANPEVAAFLDIDTVKPELARINELNLFLKNKYKTLEFLEKNNNLMPDNKQRQLAAIYNTAVIARKDILSLTTKLFGFYAGCSNKAIAGNAVRWQENFDKAGSAVSNFIRSLATSPSDDAGNQALAKEKLEDYQNTLNTITVGVGAACLELEMSQKSSPMQRQ